VVGALENWWDKYSVTLRSMVNDRDAAADELTAYLVELGYE
jgi:type I restriction enzyme M protein